MLKSAAVSCPWPFLFLPPVGLGQPSRIQILNVASRQQPLRIALRLRAKPTAAAPGSAPFQIVADVSRTNSLAPCGEARPRKKTTSLVVADEQIKNG